MRLKIVFIFFIYSVLASAQSTDCKLKIGTNLSGLSDWMTEMPFVDMMHNARTWGTRNRSWIGGNAKNEWNTELIGQIETDEQGYPLELPFYKNGLALEDSQLVFTVWAWTEAWEDGVYTCLYDGEGDIEFGSDAKIIASQPGKLDIKINKRDNFVEMKIVRSKRGNHIRNIHLIMPGHEATYAGQPFNPLYLDRLKDFAAIRFMDWGSTNNWGEDASWYCDDEPEDTILKPWSTRSRMDHYTWATNKGVPYEVMCNLCNTVQKDMWICVPHNASNEFIREMATLVKNNLNPNLKVYAEYSNEIWNWMFGQTQWLNTFFCEGRGISWPEGIVDHVQNNLDIWNEVFTDQPNRLITVAGGQTAWQDVTNRIVKNLTPGSFGALNITGYFGLGNDTWLDAMGMSATAADVAAQVRKHMHDEEITYIKSQHQLAKELGVPLVFYEAGQHITPTPFGEEPTYSQALLDIQRDTALYNLYHEWFNLIENVLDENEQALYMNFSFVGDRSARYGSWGVLETLNQDTSIIYAPKFQALMEQVHFCGKPAEQVINSVSSTITPVPVHIIKRNSFDFTVIGQEPINNLTVYSVNGKEVKKIEIENYKNFNFTLSNLPSGIYLVKACGFGFEKTMRIEID